VRTEFRLTHMPHTREGGHAVFLFTVLKMPYRFYIVKIKYADRIQV